MAIWSPRVQAGPDDPLRENPIRWLLFENWIVLAAALVLIECVLLWIWARRRTPGSRRRAAAGAVLACLLPILSVLVQTDREKILAICHALAGALERGAVPDVGRHIDAVFMADSMDRSALLRTLEAVLERVRVESPLLTGFEIELTGDRARAVFGAHCRLVTDDWIETGLVSRWKLTFRRDDGRWWVTSIRPIPTAMFPYRSLDGLLQAR